MTQQALGIEALGGLHGDAVAGLIERARGGGADGRQRQIALLLEQRGAESHRVRARENDEIESLESAEARRQVAPFGQRLDLDGGRSETRSRLCASSRRHSGIGLLSGPSDQDADAVQRKHASGAAQPLAATRRRPPRARARASCSPSVSAFARAAGDAVAQQPRAVGLRHQSLERQRDPARLARRPAIGDWQLPPSRRANARSASTAVRVAASSSARKRVARARVVRCGIRCRSRPGRRPAARLRGRGAR